MTGGQFTRVLVLDAATALAAVQAMARVGEGAPAAARAEFNALCPTHQDYVWSTTSSR